jgi:Domain of unknown function (DUF6268)
MAVGGRWAVCVVVLAAAYAGAQPPPAAAILGEPRDSAGTIPLPPPPRPRQGPGAGPGSGLNPNGDLRAPVQQQDDFASLLGPGLLISQNGFPGYGATWYPEQNVKDQAAKLGIVRQELSIVSPIQRDGPDSAAVGLSIRNSIFYTGSILKDSKRAFPDTLWNISAGVAYAHKFENNWTAGIVASGGSASDRPFRQGSTLNGGLATYLAIPAEKRDYWIFGLFYSPTADFAYPLPAVAYVWRPNEDLSLDIGIPFFLNWRFFEDLTLNIFYVPIRNVRSSITWEVDKGLKGYAGFEWMNESYFLFDRENNSDRFFSYEKRLFGGVQIDLPWNLRLDLAAGYSFDRFFFQGRRFADRNNDRIGVDPGIFGTAQLRFRF